MRRPVIALVALLGLLAAALPAAAHPLGNFTVNHYTRAELSGGEVYVRYVADLAEIPALRERAAIDAAGGLHAYAARAAHDRAKDLVLEVDGRRVDLVPASQAVRLNPGQAGLRTLRLSAWYRAPGAAGAGAGSRQVTLSDHTFAGRLGWRETVLRASSGATVTADAALSRDTSNELTAYPDDRLSRPLDVTTAAFAWTPGDGPGEVADLIGQPEASAPSEGPSGLAGRLVEGDLSLGVVLLALGLAIGWGALHALSPGHGKAMVAAYLVGSRGTPRHAVLLGAFVTVTHTIGVVLLGLVALWASRYVLPEDLFPWLNLIAALLVLAVGVWVLRARFRRARALGFRGLNPLRRGSPSHGHHENGHDHSHDDHDHSHHDHDHSHQDLAHNDHDHAHHDHSGRGHTHAPPTDLSFKSLLAVGTSAGIVPCPSALVLLLGAISVQRIGYGLVLVVAFSLGLAAVLTTIGLLVLYARRLLERLPLGGRLSGAVPVLSAVTILAIGAVLTARAIPGLA